VQVMEGIRGLNEGGGKGGATTEPRLAPRLPRRQGGSGKHDPVEKAPVVE
jgi:hypothetical protein